LKTFLSDDIIVDELRETTFSLKNCYMFRVSVYVQKCKNLLDKQLFDYSFHFIILAFRIRNTKWLMLEGTVFFLAGTLFNCKNIIFYPT
jgi:hypothetical protein